MDKNRRTELMIMEQIELDGSQSQRNMSRKLGLALGLTNAYLKRLVNKGYVMVSTMPRNRIWYNLTPKGISEKASLTMLYMKDSANLYADLKRKVTQAVFEMESAGVRRVALVGDGEILEVALLGLLDTDVKLNGIYSPNIQLRRVARKPVKSLERLEDADYDAVLLADLDINDQLVDRLRRAGVDPSRIKPLTPGWLRPRGEKENRAQ